MPEAALMVLLAIGALVWRSRSRSKREEFEHSRKRLDAERLFRV